MNEGVIRGRKDYEYEQVTIDEWIEGEIADVPFRVNPNKKYKDKETQEWKMKEVTEVRFVLNLKGCNYKHYSRWMTASTSEKANLYQKYLKPLCPDLLPDSDIDVRKLVGVKVKTMWDNEKGKDGKLYQVIKNFKPITGLNPSDLLLEETAPF